MAAALDALATSTRAIVAEDELTAKLVADTADLFADLAGRARAVAQAEATHVELDVARASMALHQAADGASELMRRTRDACVRVPARGRLPPPVIQKVVRSHFGVFRKCYEDGLRRDAKLEGLVAVRFVIERDGAVRRVEEGKPAPPDPLDWRPLPDAQKRMPDPSVSSCVVEAFRQLTFPPPEGGFVTVTYPIMFTPGAP